MFPGSLQKTINSTHYTKDLLKSQDDEGPLRSHPGNVLYVKKRPGLLKNLIYVKTVNLTLRPANESASLIQYFSSTCCKLFSIALSLFILAFRLSIVS